MPVAPADAPPNPPGEAAATVSARRSRWMVALLLLATALVYAETTAFPFVHDDTIQIVANTSLRSWHSVPDYFRAGYWNARVLDGGGAHGAVYYRPVFMLWLLLNYAMFGLHAPGWHLTTVAVHLAVTFLVWRVTRQLGLDEWTALAASLIFGLHPAHVEAVAWVGGVTEVLGALFFLAAFSTYLEFRKTHRTSWLAGSLALLAAGLLAKETVAMLPLIVLAYEVLRPPADIGDRARGIRRAGKAAIAASAPFFALVALYAGLRVALFHGTPPAVSDVPLATMAFTWPSVLWFYLRHLLFPAGLSLFYDTYYFTTPGLKEFWLPLFAVIAVCSALWALARRAGARLAAFGLAWMFLLLIPVLNFRVFPWREIAHDRYLYLPSVGFCVLVALALERLSFGKRVMGRASSQLAAVAVIAFALAAGTAVESMPWSSPLLLYYHAVQIAPNNVGAVSSLALEMLSRGRTDEGVVLYERASNLAPNWSEAHLNLGMVYFRKGKFADAERHLTRGLALRPDAGWEYYYRLGLSRLALGRYMDAEEALRGAIRLQPSALGIHAALGSAFLQEGKRAEAKEQFDAELHLNPSDPIAKRGLAELE